MPQSSTIRMSLLSCLLIGSVALASNVDNDAPANMPAPAQGTQQRSTARHLRRLAKEDFKKGSQNFFDLQPHCEKLGARYCDYGSHQLGSGSEFANWHERTQFMYTNMARTDYTAFAKAYKATCKCTTKDALVPFFWSSELTQAARFHSHDMATNNFFGDSTSTKNKDLFDGSTEASSRILKFVTASSNDWAENIAVGHSSPLEVTKSLLASSGHCKEIFGTRSFLGVGYFDDENSKQRDHWTQNFLGVPEAQHDLPKQNIIAGTHDIDADTRTTTFLVQVHMSEAPTKVSVVVGGIKVRMSLLLGTAKSGTYSVDMTLLTNKGVDSDSCVPYYFDINSGAIVMPADRSYQFLTYDGKKCKRNIKDMRVNFCTCEFGTPKTGGHCTTDGAKMCASCDPGYILTNNKCEPGYNNDENDNDEGEWHSVIAAMRKTPASDGITSFGLLSGIIVGLCATLQVFLL